MRFSERSSTPGVNSAPRARRALAEDAADLVQVAAANGGAVLLAHLVAARMDGALHDVGRALLADLPRQLVEDGAVDQRAVLERGARLGARSGEFGFEFGDAGGVVH